MATRCLILYNYLRWGGYKIVVELPDDIYHLYSFWGTIKIIIVREGFIENNLFSFGGLIEWNPLTLLRDLIIEPPLLHRLFPNKYLPDYDYFDCTPKTAQMRSMISHFWAITEYMKYVLKRNEILSFLWGYLNMSNVWNCQLG